MKSANSATAATVVAAAAAFATAFAVLSASFMDFSSASACLLKASMSAFSAALVV